MANDDKLKQNASNEERLSGLRKHSEELNRLVVESLQVALLQLIGKKNYDSITVTELCKKAGVSRMAFYGNFASKDDIINKIVYDLQGEMLSRLGSPFRQEVTLKWYVDMFCFVKEKTDILQPLFCAGFRDKYLDLVNSVFLRHKDLKPDETYQRLLWSGGVVNAIVYWLSNDMAESPTDMAQFCNKCFAPFSQHIFIGDDE